MESNTILIKDVIMVSAGTKKCSVLIEDDKIVSVGNENQSKADQVIEGRGKVLLPGLVNTHTHLPMTLMRGIADDLPLDVWLGEYIWPVEAHLEGEHCYAGALLACVEMIKSGTTMANDMYFFMDEVARAVDKAGIRASICHGMIDLGDEEKRRKELQETRRIIKKCHNTADGRIKVTIGPHAPHTCSKELLIGALKMANKNDLNIHTHISETKKELDQVKETQGRRPYEYLEEIGFLGPDVLAAHSVWVSESEIKIIKDNNVKISYNPLSNMKLASGIAPMSKMMEQDITISLGTDGAASNNNLDIFQEMKMASLLQKVHYHDPTLFPADKILEMVTIGGARALGREEETGSIEVGKKADMILVDMKKPHLTPYANPASHLVYSAEGSDVNTVICDGKILMQEREILVLDEFEVMDLAQSAAEDLLSKK